MTAVPQPPPAPARPVTACRTCLCDIRQDGDRWRLAWGGSEDPYACHGGQHEPKAEHTYGQLAYDASIRVMGDDLEGGPLPWDKLPKRLQDAWQAAGEAVATDVMTRWTPEPAPARPEAATPQAVEAVAADFEKTAALAARLPADATASQRDYARGLIDGYESSAAEVRERLAPQWDALAAERDGLRGLLRDAMDEGDRYRKALEDIAERDPSALPRSFRDIARQALEGAP